MVNPMPSAEELNKLAAQRDAEWRDVAQVASFWNQADQVDQRVFQFTTSGRWWEILAETGMTLLVTREYEHLVMAISLLDDAPLMTYLSLPHPSGLAYDARRGVVHVASTRNPNQIFDLAPVTGQLARLDVADAPAAAPLPTRPLIPIRSRFLPGCTYLHDLALIDGVLHANSVGQNAIIRLNENGSAERVWWPRCIDSASGPVFGQNQIQLNSIAAGANLSDSYFSSSADRITELRPGHPQYPVDGRGVIFSGVTREPIVRGLTRPHSARLHRNRVWVDNSGYGEMGFADDGKLTPLVRLPGWTRGLVFHEQYAFVGTSRVIPRFRQYAPGLDVDQSRCGVHIVDLDAGAVLGSLFWDYGNQIFALEWVPRQVTLGFPFDPQRQVEREKQLFYAFTLDDTAKARER